MGNSYNGTPKVARKTNDGIEGTRTHIADDMSTNRERDLDDKVEESDNFGSDVQELNIRVISDAFAHEKIACAFVLPKDGDDDDSVFDRIVAAAGQADIVVIDWYLRNSRDPKLTKRVIRHIAEKDSAENGRLRLICVYTGIKETNEVVRDAEEELKKGGLDTMEKDYEKGFVRGNYHYLLVLNKQDVGGEELPDRIIEKFTELTIGLLPSFALAAVAAVRRNMHHIITKFSKDLDAAYVANRLITNPPGSAAELIRELFISECDTALGLERVADNYLDLKTIKLWLDVEKQPKDGSLKFCGDNLIDREFIEALLANGIEDDAMEVLLPQGKSVRFSTDKRARISHALHGKKTDSIEKQSLFARHVVLKREFFGLTKLYSDENWVPSLTLGSVLRQDIEEHSEPKHKYFYCLTPACDTIRLKGKKRKFLMLELEINVKKSNLLIMEESRKTQTLFVDADPGNVCHFFFTGSLETGRVMAERKGSKKKRFIFETAGDEKIELLWLGEVRRSRANRDMADLNRKWLRFGINDSEYLRLAGTGKAPLQPPSI